LTSAPSTHSTAREEPFWRGGPEALFQALTSTAEGLSEQEASSRLQRHGPNVVADRNHRPAVLELLLRFRNPLVLLLLGAGTVAALTGDRRSLVVIVTMVLLSVLLDFFQEHRAGRAAERLRRAAVVRATVLRGGAARDIPATEVVPGDVVLLCAGDLVPADGRALEARDLFVNQALLTGEPYPSRSTPARLPGGDRRRGSVGVADGDLDRQRQRPPAGRSYGSTDDARPDRASLSRPSPPTSFEQGTRAFGMLILRLTLLLVLFVLLVNGLRGRPWIDSFLFAMALAVG
jgi:Mg2+-importing ATPase